MVHEVGYIVVYAVRCMLHIYEIFLERRTEGRKERKKKGKEDGRKEGRKEVLNGGPTVGRTNRL